MLFFLGWNNVEAHFRLVYPQPRSQETGIKSYPCGPDPFWGNGQATTTLSPGEVTIRWEETISHRGAPFRMALSWGDDNKYDDYILLDHIPHNDAGSASYSSPKKYAYRIMIPDVQCERCSFQIVNPMTDKIPSGSSCSYPTGTNVCFSVYHSCANVKITGSTPIDQWNYNYTGPTGPYTQQSGSWNQDENGVWWSDGQEPSDNSSSGNDSIHKTNVMSFVSFFVSMFFVYFGN